jgi:ABC-2 type transport system ATP-binding protein
MITATHLTRRFGAKTALDDISLRIEPGELFGLIGPDGAGKTTFFRIVARRAGADLGHGRRSSRGRRSGSCRSGSRCTRTCRSTRT